MNHTHLVKAITVTVLTLSFVGIQVLGGEPQDDVPLGETASEAVETTTSEHNVGSEDARSRENHVSRPSVRRVAVQETGLEVKNQVPYVKTAVDPETEMRVYTYFSDIPEMIAVAKCESTLRHFNSNGNVLRGRAVSSDIGVMQINEYFHGTRSEQLGYDIYTLEGNLGYARYLYEQYGLQPWSASKPCWNNSSELANR